MGFIRHIPINRVIDWGEDPTPFAVHDLEQALDALREACQKNLALVREESHRIRVALGELCRIDALVNPMDVP